MKFNIKTNNSTDVLLVDDGYSNFKPSKLKYVLLKNEVYLFYLIKSLFYSIIKMKLSITKIKNEYFKHLINSFNPKIAIGNDINQKITRIQNEIPKVKTITYQIGYLFKGEDETNYKQFLNNIDTDYFCVLNKNSKKFIKKNLSTNIFLTGSIKNNEKKIANKKMIYDFFFISQYRPINKKFNKNSKYLNYERDKMRQIILILAKFCEKKKKTLVIALSSSREEKQKHDYSQEEKFFFKSIYSKVLFLENKNSFEIASLCKVGICLNSNLGAELLAQGKKVIFFSISKYAKFFFEKKTYMNNINTFNEESVNKKLNLVLNIKKNNWSKYCKRNQLIDYDYKNKKLNKLINKIIKD